MQECRAKARSEVLMHLAQHRAALSAQRWAIVRCCVKCIRIPKENKMNHDRIIADDEFVQAPCYVTVCLDDRAYGGPEEGGWYYSTRQIVEKHYCATLPTLCAVMQRVQRNYFDVSRYDVGSVLSEGVYTTFIGTDIPEEYPTERPHYE